MNLSKDQQNFVAICIFFVGILFIYFKYIYSPLSVKYKEESTKFVQLQTKLNEMIKRASELPKLKAEMEVLSKLVEELEKKLPKEKGVPKLLKIITQEAQKFQLKIMNFVPAGINANPDYNEIPFQIQMKGNFHSFGHFFTMVGQKERVLNIKNVQFNRIAETGNSEKHNTVDVNFVLNTYTYKE